MDDRCFEYCIVVVLHRKEIKNQPERIQGIHHYFSCEHSWWGMYFLVGIKEWKRFEKMKQFLLIICKYHIMK